MRLSVVVAAFNSAESLRRCLRSVVFQLTTDDEVIVSTNLSSDAISPLKVEFPQAEWLSLDSSTNVPLLRARGAGRARGTIIGFTEDHFFLDQNWVRAITCSFEEGNRAVGGAIEMLEASSALDRAMYFFDYGRYMPPLESGEMAAISGANAAFDRELLTAGLLKEGLYEVVVGRELRSRGVMLRANPDAIVFHAGVYVPRRALSAMCNGGRNYAGLVMSGRNMPARLTHALSTPLLMIVFPVRTVLLIWRKGRLRAELLASLPWLLLISASWAVGEFLGAMTGGGDSAARWK